MTPEGLIKNQICSYLKFKGIFFWMNDSVGIYDPVRNTFRSNRSPYRIKGVSDLLGIFQGRLLAIEVKSKKGRLSPEQAFFLEEVNRLRGLAFVARCVEDVEQALKKELEKTHPHVELERSF